MKIPALKTALLAASAFTLAGVATAHAAEPAAPIEIVAPVAHAADEAPAAPAGKLLRNVGLAAAAAAALAAFLKLIGARRIADFASAAAPVAARAASEALRAPAKVAKAIGRAAASPIRFAVWMASLGLFALTGLSLFDIEWAGGLAAGMALAALAFIGTASVRRTLTLRPVPAKAARTRPVSTSDARE